MDYSVTQEAIPGINVSVKELIAQASSRITLPLNVLKRTQGTFVGNEQSFLRGRGVDFAESRVYQAGDDIRHMDWRVTARTNIPHTKVFHEERERPVYFLVDHNPSMFFGTQKAFKSVIAAKLCAQLAWEASREGCSVGGMVYSGERLLETKPKLRKYGVLPLLRHLSVSSFAPHEKNNEESMQLALLRLQRHVKPGSMIFMLSDFQGLNVNVENSLGQLSQHNKIFLYPIFDKLEKVAPPPNIYPITDGKSTRVLNTQEKSFCRRYEESFTKEMARLKKLCGRLGMEYGEI